MATEPTRTDLIGVPEETSAPPVNPNASKPPSVTLDQDLEIVKMAAKEAFANNPYESPKGPIPPAELHPKKEPGLLSRLLGGSPGKKEPPVVPSKSPAQRDDPLRLPEKRIPKEEFKRRLAGPQHAAPKLTSSQQPSTIK
jgi:hypothetical protein